jgi:hypothetical protein
LRNSNTGVKAPFAAEALAFCHGSPDDFILVDIVMAGPVGGDEILRCKTIRT